MSTRNIPLRPQQAQCVYLYNQVTNLTTVAARTINNNTLWTSVLLTKYYTSSVTLSYFDRDYCSRAKRKRDTAQCLRNSYYRRIGMTFQILRRYLCGLHRVLTAFLKCMSYANGVQISNEPFVCG